MYLGFALVRIAVTIGIASRPRSTQLAATPAPQEYTLDDDGEPDEFPHLIPDEKGLKVENIHTFEAWRRIRQLSPMASKPTFRYKADRTRFHNAKNQIIYATSRMVDKLLGT
jgi:hypothetical protein